MGPASANEPYDFADESGVTAVMDITGGTFLGKNPSSFYDKICN